MRGLRIFLATHNLTQKEMAEKSGVSEVTFSQLMNGRMDPKRSTLEAILSTAQQFDPSITYEQLYEQDSEPIAAAGGK